MLHFDARLQAEKQQRLIDDMLSCVVIYDSTFIWGRYAQKCQ